MNAQMTHGERADALTAAATALRLMADDAHTHGASQSIVLAMHAEAEALTRHASAQDHLSRELDFPTCQKCGRHNVEDAGDHADTFGHWPT